ncbi:MAG: DUF1013 domain-containing protein [Proteobacteria bacterium]|nr:DUF1013 domain-containing protein [Pseudomonadota bacterium]
MGDILMPKATAVWLIDNTTLTFEQIAEFCELHILQVQAIADGDVDSTIQGSDPLMTKQLTREEISRCEADPSLRLAHASIDLPQPTKRTKGPNYTPLNKRGDKPDAIAWLLKHHPNMTGSQICKLIGTTRETIAKIRNRTHIQSQTITAKHPVMLGLCSQEALNAAIAKAGDAVPPPEEQMTDVSELP